VRIDGHMSTERFVGAWGAGADSFASDPPNAVLSILDDDRTPAVVELREPTLTDDAVRFRVEVQSGEIPASFGQAALFIDSLGLAGPTLGLGLHGSASSALQDPRLDLPMRQAYYRAFAPDQADPLNPNLVPRQDHEEGYHFANDENGPPQLGLTAPHRDLSRYYGD
jgi:hypothetical protein